MIASRATEELTVALKEQIEQGLIEVEQRGEKVFVTVGSGGAFPSGTADLTDEAQRIMDRISLTAMSPDSTITVPVTQITCRFQMDNSETIGI